MTFVLLAKYYKCVFSVKYFNMHMFIDNLYYYTFYLLLFKVVSIRMKKVGVIYIYINGKYAEIKYKDQHLIMK